MMQAIELITKDNFLEQFNISIDTSDIMYYMKKAMHVWFDSDYYENYEDFEEKEYTYYNEIHFMYRFQVEFAEIITSKGFCYSFNIGDASNLFHLERFVAQI